MVNREAVGAPVIRADLIVLAFVAPASQVKDLPLVIVATKVSPKLSNDQLPGSKITLEVARSVPHVESPQRYVPQP